jgi:hypothetical protein
MSFGGKMYEKIEEKRGENGIKRRKPEERDQRESKLKR